MHLLESSVVKSPGIKACVGQCSMHELQCPHLFCMGVSHGSSREEIISPKKKKDPFPGMISCVFFPINRKIFFLLWESVYLYRKIIHLIFLLEQCDNLVHKNIVRIEDDFQECV